MMSTGKLLRLTIEEWPVPKSSMARDTQGQPSGVHRALGEGLGHFLDELGVAQLQGGEVHAHPQGSIGGELLSEAARLAAGLGEHPSPQGDDHARLLGHGDELRREQQAPLRILPPDQSLEADHFARAYPHLGLVVDPQLLARYRPS